MWSYISFRFLDVLGQTIKSLALLFPLKVKVTDLWNEDGREL